MTDDFLELLHAFVTGKPPELDRHADMVWSMGERLDDGAPSTVRVAPWALSSAIKI